MATASRALPGKPACASARRATSPNRLSAAVSGRSAFSAGRSSFRRCSGLSSATGSTGTSVPACFFRPAADGRRCRSDYGPHGNGCIGKHGVSIMIEHLPLVAQIPTGLIVGVIAAARFISRRCAATSSCSHLRYAGQGTRPCKAHVSGLLVVCSSVSWRNSAPGRCYAARRVARRRAASCCAGSAWRHHDPLSASHHPLFHIGPIRSRRRSSATWVDHGDAGRGRRAGTRAACRSRHRKCRRCLN